MATFEDVYTVPNLAYEISSFLSVDDEMRLDQVSKTIHSTNREWVYGMYRVMNVDDMIKDASSVDVAIKYLKKIGPYIETLTFDGNRHEISMLSIEYFPNLRELEFGVPLVLNTSHREIDVSTHRIWLSLRKFLKSLTQKPNKVRKIRIVPGVIKIIETNFEEPIVREKQCCVDDRSHESHLLMYRRFRMPPVLWPDWYALPRFEEFHAPLYLLSYGTGMVAKEDKNIKFTDWPRGTTTGVICMMYELFH